MDGWMHAGSDGVLALWHDSTESVAAEETKERNARILSEQACANAVSESSLLFIRRPSVRHSHATIDSCGRVRVSWSGLRPTKRALRLRRPCISDPQQALARRGGTCAEAAAAAAASAGALGAARRRRLRLAGAVRGGGRDCGGGSGLGEPASRPASQPASQHARTHARMNARTDESCTAAPTLVPRDATPAAHLPPRTANVLGY
jgi:hypothetical protein